MGSPEKPIIDYAGTEDSKAPRLLPLIVGRIVFSVAVIMVLATLFVVLYVAVYLVSLGHGSPLDH